MKMLNMTELYNKIKLGEIKESDLYIQINDDGILITLNNELILSDVGFMEIYVLCKLLFPNALIEWF